MNFFSFQNRELFFCCSTLSLRFLWLKAIVDENIKTRFLYKYTEWHCAQPCYMRKRVKSNKFRFASLRNLENAIRYLLKELRRALDVLLKYIHHSTNDPMLPSENFAGWLRLKWVYTVRVQTSRSCVEDGYLRTHREYLLWQKCLLFGVDVV